MCAVRGNLRQVQNRRGPNTHTMNHTRGENQLFLMRILRSDCPDLVFTQLLLLLLYDFKRRIENEFIAGLRAMDQRPETVEQIFITRFFFVYFFLWVISIFLFLTKFIPCVCFTTANRLFFRLDLFRLFSLSIPRHHPISIFSFY